MFLKRILPYVFGLSCILIYLPASAQPAQSNSASTTSSDPTVSSTNSTLSGPQNWQAQIEAAKLEEQKKATYLTLATVVVSMVVGFGTIVYNISNSSKQAKLQAKLKALEVVISAAGPNTARQRLVVVGQLLGDDLVPNTLGETLVVEGVGAGHDQNRKDLMKMLMENSGKEMQVLELWEITFGKSKLGEDIRAIRAALLEKEGREKVKNDA